MPGTVVRAGDLLENTLAKYLWPSGAYILKGETEKKT